MKSTVPKVRHRVEETHRFTADADYPQGDGQIETFIAQQGEDDFWHVGSEWGHSLHIRAWQIPALIAVLNAALRESGGAR